jgi:hypothetical protein
LNPKHLGIVSLVTLLLVGFWLGIMIWDVAGAGPLDTFEQVLAYASRLDAKYYLNYADAVLYTLLVTALLTGLYVYLRPALPEWTARVGVVFVPVYCVLNVFAYFSQITVVPALLALYQVPSSQAAAEVWLRMTLQLWPGSLVGVFNGLAYAIVGIPSLIFGLALVKLGGARRAAGILLALNAVTCAVGIIGYLVGSSALRMGTLLGGALFFLALFPLTWALLRDTGELGRQA